MGAVGVVVVRPRPSKPWIRPWIRLRIALWGEPRLRGGRTIMDYAAAP